MDHPISENCLERFVIGRATPAENRSMVAHLLRGCSACSRKLAALLRPEVHPASYDMVFARVEKSLPDTWSTLRREDYGPVLAQAR